MFCRNETVVFLRSLFRHHPTSPSTSSAQLLLGWRTPVHEASLRTYPSPPAPLQRGFIPTKSQPSWCPPLQPAEIRPRTAVNILFCVCWYRVTSQCFLFFVVHVSPLRQRCTCFSVVEPRRLENTNLYSYFYIKEQIKKYRF